MAVSEQGDYLVDANGVKGPLQDDFGRGDPDIVYIKKTGISTGKPKRGTAAWKLSSTKNGT